MKKFLALGVLLAAVIAGVGAWKHNETPPSGLPSGGEEESKPVVKIGAVLPLTGPLAEEGVNNQAGMQVAWDKHKNGPVDFELVFEDSAFNPAKTAVIAHKLIDVDKADVLLSWSGTSGKVISPIADKAGIVHLSITNNKDAAAGARNFTLFTSTESKVRKLLEIARRRQARKVSLFAINSIGLQYTTDAVQKLLEENGIEVVRQDFNSDLRDFGLMVDKAAKEGSDLWILSALPPSLDIFLKTYRDKGVEVPLTSADSFAVAKHKELLEGLEYVVDTPGKGGVMAEIRPRASSDNLYLAGFSYDAVNILMGIYEDFYEKNGRMPNPDELAESLMNLDYSGAVGRLTVREDGEIESEATIERITAGKAEVAE